MKHVMYINFILISYICNYDYDDDVEEMMLQ